MKKSATKKVIAGISSIALLCSVFTQYQTPDNTAKADSDVIFATGFEDGEGVDKFSGRGETEVLEASDEVAHSGKSSLCVSERSESWNGPQFRLDDKCEAGVEYYVSANVKTEWYSTINLSMQYTDSEGEIHYSNVKSYGGSDWAEFKDVKVSFTSDATDVYVYFEASDANTKIYLDDFELKAAPVIPIEQDIPSLYRVYSKYFKMGTAICPSNLASKSYMDLVDKHFKGSITLGNEMKPDYVLNKAATQKLVEETGDDTNPQVSLGAAKSVLDYCRDNNIPVRGHCLVWHSQTPDWFFKENFSDDGDWVSKEKMIERMENYIKNLFDLVKKEYPTVDFYAWDVVNEAWTDDGKPRTPGSNNQSNGSSAWVKVFGDNSFIEYAFKYAKQYAPENCKLYYNDYNEYIQGKLTAICDMAQNLKEKGYIDGIGMQAHLDVGFPSAAMFENALKQYVATGLDVQITELDITTDDHSEAGLKKQAEMYRAILDSAVKYADNVSAVVIWGVTDDTSWRATQTPLIFDKDFKAKPAYYSMIEGYEVPVDPIVTTPQVTTPVVTTKPENPVTTEPTPLAIYGDLDGNGKVDLSDLTALSLHLLGDKKLGNEVLKYADVNDDSDVDISDLALLQQYVCKDPITLGPKTSK